MAIARAIVSVVVGGSMAVLILWFFLPFLHTVYTNVTTQMDDGSDYFDTLVTYGDMIFNILPILVLVVMGWLIFAAATERAPFDR